MSDVSGPKKKSKANSDVGKILLIDEPEAFLHPPTIRSAREALYDFALNNPDWQVIATTHSPIFVDLSKDHTTIIRVDTNAVEQRFVSTDQVSFDTDERTRLQMVRACNPIVNEFFFYDNIVLVEGPTEHLVVKHVASKIGLEVHVINSMGKANVPIFARILNHFKVPYLAIHDSDTPKVNRKGSMVTNGAWTLNEKIRMAVSSSTDGHIFVQVPHFEGEFLDEALTNGKVDRVLEVLAEPKSYEYQLIMDTYTKALTRNPSILTTTVEAFESKQNAYITKKGLSIDPSWA